MAVKKLRINNEIQIKEIRLIDNKGEQKGIVAVSEALEMAQEAELDLVEIAPQAKPPVCKILDYGKYRFEQEKRLRESKKKQKMVKLKEIRMQPRIEKHDLEFKAKHVKQFLDEGNRVKVTVRFRGRELAHTELGKKVLDNILVLLNGSCIIDKNAKMEGKFMSMFLAPKIKN